MIRSQTGSAAVFSRYGLRAESFIRLAIPQEEPLAVRLRQALEELGGLYVAFGIYLQWRSDLLTSGQIDALSSIRVESRGLSRLYVADLLVTRLAEKGEILACTLSDSPEWITLNRTAYRAFVSDQPVIIQVAHPVTATSEITAFRKGILALGAPDLAHLTHFGVLDQFVEWLRTAETTENERDFLEAVNAPGVVTGTNYPQPVPHLCGQGLLIWPLIDGQRVDVLVSRGNPEVLALVAEAVLEQFCVLGMVEGDLRLDAMVVTGEKTLAFRRLSRPTATPPGLTAAALEYIAATITRNAALSTRALLRLAISYESPILERELVQKLSAVDPELKVQRWFPPSAETFEANWRAVSKLNVPRSLFLDCLHRNIVAMGYWIGDAVRAGAPLQDSIAEGQWPVVGRLLRTRIAAAISPEVQAQWAAASGLFTLGLMKEASRLAAEVRDNRLSMGFDITTKRVDTLSTRPRWLAPFGVFLLTIFLLCLRWGNLAPPIWLLPVQALTITTFAGLFWVVLRIR